MTTYSLDRLRRAAKALKRDYIARDGDAQARVTAIFPQKETLAFADALHVIAREAGFESWPKLKFKVETDQMDRADRAKRLGQALFYGRHWRVKQLLWDHPDLGESHFGLSCALYDIDTVRSRLAQQPQLATTVVEGRSPILHLAFSQHVHGAGSEADMRAVAEALLQHGADVDDTFALDYDPGSKLSALYGAMGHANNMPLSAWLLSKGANPDDNESLYHATELGHHDGLRLLIEHGVTVAGTNAIPRALDFNDHMAVEMLLAAGGDTNEGIAAHTSNEPSFVIPALHQAARRMCDGRMFDILLGAGADPNTRYNGLTPYALARVYGNRDGAAALEKAGADRTLSDEEALLAQAAEGEVPSGIYIDTAKMPDEYRSLLQKLVATGDRLAHIKRLVGIGVEYDYPDAMGLTPVQIAGWEGLPEEMAYLLSLKPDLSHINGYGGTLLSTIIHGSENCPARAERDHIECARLALAEGVALPKPAIRLAGEESMAAFLADWAQNYPGQVVEEGIG